MALSLQVLNREAFESRTQRALLGGLGAGVLAALAHTLRLPVDVGWLAVVGASLAAARPAPGARAAQRVMLAVLPLLPFALDAPREVKQGLSGAIAAALVTKWGLGRDEPTPLPAVGASAAAAGLLVPLGVYVQQVMEARVFNGASGLLPAMLGLAVVALFWSIGTLPAQVRLHTDAVEARGAALATSLQGEGRALAERALGLYRQSKALAAKLAPSPGRTELVGTLEKMAGEAFSLAEAHAGLEAQLSSVVLNDVDQQVADLKARAAATEDAVARRQLELAASSLGEELNHLDALARRRERLLAQLHAQVALLERARVSLVGARGGEAGDKGAQAARLARRLAALGQEDGAPAPAPVDAPRPTRING